MTYKSKAVRKIARNAFQGLFFLATCLLLPATSSAQSPVNVTATVKDSAGIPYSNATVSILLIPTGTAPTVGGAQINGTNNGQLDVNGKLNVSLYKNTDIVPASSQWQFTICETPGVAPPLGTGGQCFTSSQTVSAAVDFSTQFQAAAKSLTTVTVGGAGSVTHTGGALTANLPVIGAGGADIAVGTRTGNTTLFPTFNGAATAARCVDTDASGNLQVTTSDCGTSGTFVAVGGGTAQAQTVAPVNPITNATLAAWATNAVMICWDPIANNTGAGPTLAGSGSSTFSAKSITKYGTVALVANDITTLGIACAIYDGTQFQLQVPLAGGVYSGSLSIGSGASACGTATACVAVVEAATACSPVVGQDCHRPDSVTNHDICAWNGNAETSCNPGIPSSWTAGNLASLGTWPGLTDSANAHGVSKTLACEAASASGTAYTCTTSPSFTPADLDAVMFEADVASTGSATLAVNGAAAATIKKQGGGTNIAANDLLANQWTLMIFDGTNWQMQGQSGLAAGGSGTVANCATTNALAIYTAGTTTGCGNADFTYATHTLTMGASGLFNAVNGAVGSFQIPFASGVPPGGKSGAVGIDSSVGGFWYSITSSTNSYVVNAGASGVTSTTCTNQVLTAVSSFAAPTCTPLSEFVTSDYTNATTTLSNVTGLAIPLAANTNYAVSCKLIYQGSAATASMVLSSTGPASPTKVSAQNTQTTTSGAGAAIYSAASDGTTFAFTLGPTAIVTTATDLPSTLDIGIMNGANAGTFQLQAKANGAGTVTIKQGSFCKQQ